MYALPALALEASENRKTAAKKANKNPQSRFTDSTPPITLNTIQHFKENYCFTSTVTVPLAPMTPSNEKYLVVIETLPSPVIELPFATVKKSESKETKTPAGTTTFPWISKLGALQE
jgi:hypothetical protein